MTWALGDPIEWKSGRVKHRGTIVGFEEPAGVRVECNDITTDRTLALRVFVGWSEVKRPKVKRAKKPAAVESDVRDIVARGCRLPAFKGPLFDADSSRAVVDIDLPPDSKDAK